MIDHLLEGLAAAAVVAVFIGWPAVVYLAGMAGLALLIGVVGSLLP